MIKVVFRETLDRGEVIGSERRSEVSANVELAYYNSLCTLQHRHNAVLQY